MIDKILVLTLRRCPDRHWSFLGASRMRDIPTEIISFVEGHDGKDFESMNEIAIFADQDGFGFVENFAIGTKTEFCQQTKASVSQVWNYARILKHISENEHTCLILNDDKMITISFHVLNAIIGELQSIEDQEFLLAQLRHRGDLNELNFEGKDRFQQAEVSKNLYSAIFHQVIPSYKDMFFKPGIQGYEESMVLSPAGANWILRSLEDEDDFYIYYDHFIHKKLTLDGETAIGQNKGIWTPSEDGYKFVDEIMPMGTTTDWAPEGSHHFERAHEKTEVVWEGIP